MILTFPRLNRPANKGAHIDQTEYPRPAKVAGPLTHAPATPLHLADGGMDTVTFSGKTYSPQASKQAISTKMLQSGNSDAVSNRVLRLAKRASSWSHQLSAEGRHLSFQLTPHQRVILESLPKNGQKQYTLTVIQYNAPQKFLPPISGQRYEFTLDRARFYDVFDKLTDIASPQIEKQYRLDHGLDGTRLLLQMADTTNNGRLRWHVLQANDEKSLGMEAGERVLSTSLQDGTRVTIHEVPHLGTSITQASPSSPEIYMAMNRPGLPPQAVMIGSEQEQEAYGLLKTAIDLAKKESRLQPAKSSLRPVMQHVPSATTPRVANPTQTHPPDESSPSDNQLSFWQYLLPRATQGFSSTVIEEEPLQHLIVSEDLQRQQAELAQQRYLLARQIEVFDVDLA